MTARPRVGVVGLGAMGSRMARRLVEAGFDVVVHNRTRAREQELVARGAKAAQSPREVALAADVVVGCLVGDEAVRQVYLGGTGPTREGQLFIEHATFSPSLAREVAASFSVRGAGFLDAPVSGGPEGAAAGTLAVMVGGDSRYLEVAAPVLRAYASTVTHVGPPGAGLELKLVNQLLVGCHAAAAAEAEQLLRRLGIPLEVAASVLTAGWAASAMFDRLVDRRLTAGSVPSQATVAGLEEPQRLVRELLVAHHVTAAVSTSALDLFAVARSSGRGPNDLTEPLETP